MRIDQHIAHIRSQGDRLVELVAAGDLTTTVPTCPEWPVGELARHMGRVHRWAGAIVRDRIDHPVDEAEEQAIWGEMPDDAALTAWQQAGVDGLVAALTAAPPDLACWSFLPAPSPLAFWARRQCHETTIHRVDAEIAVTGNAGEALPIELAVDGVDELLLAFFSRPGNRVRSAEPKTIGVVAADADAAWLIHVGERGSHGERLEPGQVDAARPDASVSGPASSLYIGLWNRGELKVDGDEALLELWRGSANIRWS